MRLINSWMLQLPSMIGDGAEVLISINPPHCGHLMWLSAASLDDRRSGSARYLRPGLCLIERRSSRANRVMRAVLDLDPMGRSARTVEAISVLRNDAFQPHQTGMPEKVRSNRA